MMVVDGCFIVQVIRTCMMNKDRDPYRVLSLPGMLSRIQNDLFLLENQLPWKVLDCLFNLTTTSDKSSLHELTLDLTCEIMNNPIIICYLGYKFMDKQRTTWQFRHLLTNVRDLLVGSSMRNEDIEEMRYKCWTAIPSVTHLEEIGVQFQCAPLHTCLLNITFNFEKGVMEIPWMEIRANTESLFRNLIAYEQCSLMPHYILSYATMFNQLIKSTKDLHRLIQKGIIYTELSKEDTVFLFRRLCNDTDCISFLYSKLANDVDRYSHCHWRRSWLAGIKRDYLYNPSSIWSVSNAVIIVLILTIIHTVYSILAYYKQ
ncbi:hypothetical protein ACFX2I_025411 [Malus domestica]|uniref:UPF0481 protein At3g47200-like n=1 Tax=Malus domestica TaxID=3750 RepID=UPI003975D703